MIEYMHELDKLGMKIFEMLASGLGLEDDFFTKSFEEKEAIPWSESTDILLVPFQKNV